eukprot:TRINITY_DN3905_c0_g1_i8.p2 TRINITY_DN3905_c0_g1~~TRINITY_DN3905_c0_g1_i8.p2  ORF type:complete len:109 (+),score=20.46 TRINITY_DN3905_c0_g1_i8:189-515(+)
MKVASEKCQVCAKSVYATERLSADEKVYHKLCFRCEVCHNALSLGKYASLENKTYCKPCFKKLFLSKGNYSEGFGHLKPQQQHDAKKAGSEGEVILDGAETQTEVTAE